MDEVFCNHSINNTVWIKCKLSWKLCTNMYDKVLWLWVWFHWLIDIVILRLSAQDQSVLGISKWQQVWSHFDQQFRWKWAEILQYKDIKWIQKSITQWSSLQECPCWKHISSFNAIWPSVCIQMGNNCQRAEIMCSGTDWPKIYV